MMPLPDMLVHPLSKRGPFDNTQKPRSMHFNLIVYLVEVDFFNIHRWIISSKRSGVLLKLLQLRLDNLDGAVTLSWKVSVFSNKGSISSQMISKILAAEP